MCKGNGIESEACDGECGAFISLDFRRWTYTFDRNVLSSTLNITVLMIAILEPILHESSQLYPNMCVKHTREIHPTDFVHQICDNTLTQSFIEKAICDGESNCFQCDTQHVQTIGTTPITVSKCDVTPELKTIDRHAASHLCHRLTQKDTWGMCDSKDDFNRLHCPAITMFMGKYNFISRINLPKLSIFEIFSV